jgi:regulator of protease activity HflC (stomatin/prohibitin superfamily)
MALDGGAIFGIILAVLVVVAAVVVHNTCYVVHQGEAIMVERMGRFSRVLEPGLHFLVPFIDSPRNFAWRKAFVDLNGVVRDETVNGYRIDLRESVFNFLRQDVYSRDTVCVLAGRRGGGLCWVPDGIGPARAGAVHRQLVLPTVTGH